MVAVEVIFVFEFSFVNNWFISPKSLLIGHLKFNQKIHQKCRLLERFFKLINFDVEKGKISMNVATHLFSKLIGAVYSDNRGTFDQLPFEIGCVRVDGEGFVEGGVEVGRGQREEVVVMGEGEDTHAHFVGLLVFVLFHKL